MMTDSESLLVTHGQVVNRLPAKQGDSLLARLSGRPGAVASVFIVCATVVPRAGRSYDSWLSEVTRRFVAAWDVIEP